MNFKFIRCFAVSSLLMAATTTVFGQDLIARQAPIDRKLKAVDSVALQRLLEKERLDGLDLYSSWNTQYAHCYGQAALPDSFKIDLRGFSMPTPSRNVTSKYGYRPTFRRMHYGLDVKVYTGDTICAAFDGKVRVVKYDGHGYGKYVVIRHENGLETLYGHMSKQLVETNQEVKAGEPIGLGGNTGFSRGSHLHFETRLLGKAIDPALLFDFENQDVTGDYFVYHKDQPRNDGKMLASGARNANGNTNVASAEKRPGGSRYYKVKKGESLYSIAGKLGLSVSQLCSVNSLGRKTKIRPGQILRY